MNDEQAKELIDKLVGQIFGFQNPFTVDQFSAKFAFDIRLTSEVTETHSGESTWAQSTQGNKFIKFENLLARDGDGKKPPKKITSIDDIMKYWQDTNITSSERYLDSINIGKSDAVYGSQNVYRGIDIHDSKFIAFCNTVSKSEYVAASQRSNTLTFSIRVDDSNNINSSFQVSWSKNISKSFFIKDCGELSDSMFCTGINDGRFMIANMQFEEEEYRKWEKLVKEWILKN